jgi:hypothetical protein
VELNLEPLSGLRFPPLGVDPRVQFRFPRVLHFDHLEPALAEPVHISSHASSVTFLGVGKREPDRVRDARQRLARGHLRLRLKQASHLSLQPILALEPVLKAYQAMAYPSASRSGIMSRSQKWSRS